MERGHPCPPEREARTWVLQAERALHAGGQDVRDPRFNGRLPFRLNLLDTFAIEYQTIMNAESGCCLNIVEEA
jgi:hypothetical protein